MSADVSVIILTYNEEVNLPACLESLGDLGCEVFVVDSGSTDRTVEIAKRYGAEVVYHGFETQARQLNWALDHLPLKGEWVVRLDADERLSPELVQEIRSAVASARSDITGFYVKRRVYFLGRWIRHGGYYPIWLLRIRSNGCARSEDRSMDEHTVLLKGKASFLRHDIVERNAKGLSAWIERQNSYASREAKALLNGDSSDEVKPRVFGTPEARRRWLKQKVYLRFPPFIRAFLYFIFRYVFQLGFLDGKEGLIFHFLQGCWYRFLVDAKIHEVRERQRTKGGCLS